MFFRTLYIFFSYLLCLLYFFNTVDIIFLSESYPLLSLLKKRFIATGLTDLIDVVWMLSNYFSLIFISPFFMYHIRYFLSSSWYKHQLDFYSKLITTVLLVFIFSFLFFHYVVLPDIFNFLIYWEIKDETSLLRIELEARIISYINWVFTFKSIICFFTCSTSLMLINYIFFTRITQLYIIIKLKKNLFIFCLISFCFFLTPPDFFLQICLIIFLFILYDLFLFLVCVKFYKFKCQQYISY